MRAISSGVIVEDPSVAGAVEDPSVTETPEKSNGMFNEIPRSASEKKYNHRCIVGDINFKHIKWETFSTAKGEGSTESNS